jgi:enediyne biosynthesis protein E4
MAMVASTSSPATGASTPATTPHLNIPSRSTFGELDQPGVVHLLETAFAPELDKVVPVRSLNALGQAFPPLLERFPTHHAFSTAGINDILPLFDTAPDSAPGRTTLTNMVFLNRGAHFEPRPLPVQAQLAPAFAIAVADWDGDGTKTSSSARTSSPAT